MSRKPISTQWCDKTIGFIGAGTATKTFGRHLIFADHKIVVSNSRGLKRLPISSPTWVPMRLPGRSDAAQGHLYGWPVRAPGLHRAVLAASERPHLSTPDPSLRKIRIAL
jgi:hypothetical protein